MQKTSGASRLNAQLRAARGAAAAILRSKRQQRFDPGSYFVEHLCRGLAYESGSALLPGGASQLIGPDNAADLLTLRQCDVKAPVAIPPRYWTGNAATGQLVKCHWRQNKRGPPSGLFIGNGLQEIQPNHVARIGAVGRHPHHASLPRLEPQSTSSGTSPRVIPLNNSSSV